MSYEHDHFHPDRQRVFKVIPDLIASSGTNINELKLIGDFSSMPAIPPTTDTSFYVNSTQVVNPYQNITYIGNRHGGFGYNLWDVGLNSLNIPSTPPLPPYSLPSTYQNMGHPLIVPKEDIIIDTIVYPQSTFMSAWGTVTGPRGATVYIVLYFHPCVDETEDVDGDTLPDGPFIITPIVMASTFVHIPIIGGDPVENPTFLRCWNIPWFEFPQHLSPTPTSHHNLIYVGVRWTMRGGDIPDGNYPFTYSIQIENEAVV